MAVFTRPGFVRQQRLLPFSSRQKGTHTLSSWSALPLKRETGTQGFEPRLTVLETVVLPLH